MKKRFYYIGNFKYPDGNAAGKRVFGICQLIRNSGNDFTTIGLPSKKLNFVQGENNNYYFNPKSLLSRAISHKKDLKFVKSIISKDMKKDTQDIIIYYGTPSNSLFIRGLIKYARNNNILIVADVVDWLSSDSNSHVFNILKNIDTYYMKAILNKRADAIITISKYLERYYLKSVNNIVVIPPIITTPLPSETYESRNNVIVFIYAGQTLRKSRKSANVSNIKDRIDLVFESLKTVKLKNIQFQFNVYGFSKDDYLLAFPKHKTLIEYLGNSIYFGGVVPNDVVISKLEKSDFSILIRDNTRTSNAGFPTKVAESVSLGVPVITTDTSDITLYLEKGREVLITNPDVIGIVEAITKIVNNKKLVHQMKMYCRVNSSFRLDTYSPRWNDFVDKLK